MLVTPCSVGRSYLVLGFAWDNAEPAAVLLALLVLPSLRTFEAAEAARALVCLGFDFAIGFPSFLYYYVLNIQHIDEKVNQNTIYSVCAVCTYGGCVKVHKSIKQR